MLDELQVVATDALSVEPSLDSEVKRQLQAAFLLLELPPVARAQGVQPTSTDLRAIRAEGMPWTLSVPVADELRRLSEASLWDLATLLVAPDDDLVGRIFHLAVLGELLIPLKADAQVTSLRPLSGTSRGPAYAVRCGCRVWDLWFEGAGAWRYYGYSTPYQTFSAGSIGAVRPLGPDLLFVDHDRTQAVALECKWTADKSEYVTRHGYLQAVTYAMELTAMGFSRVTSLVVGPAKFLRQSVTVPTAVGSIAITSPDEIATMVLPLLECGALG